MGREARARCWWLGGWMLQATESGSASAGEREFGGLRGVYGSELGPSFVGGAERALPRGACFSVATGGAGV